MSNTQYGGRYSDNFIKDVTPPEEQSGLIPVREGMDGFRPFEAVADNFLNTSPVRPRVRKVAVTEAESPYAVPVSIGTTHREPTDYTYVPPISTLRPDNEQSVDQSTGQNKFVTSVKGLYTTLVHRPYRAVVNFWDEHMLTRKYSVDEGAGYRFDRNAEDSLIAAGIGALLIAGLLVVSYGLLDNEVKRGNNSQPTTTHQTTPSSQSNKSNSTGTTYTNH